MTATTKEIEAVLAELCRLWTTMNQPTICDLWDDQEAEPYALPQEKEAPIIGWDELRAYYTQARDRLVRCSMRVANMRAKPIGDGLVVALYDMHWNGEIKGFDHLFGIDSRVTAIFRNRGDGWRLCHYIEAPAAPMLHLQKYYSAMVDDDFK